LVNIAKVKENPSNPRFIKDAKFKKLVKSIKGFPEMLEKRPIVVDEDMVVLGGNMRLKACKSAGLFEVWVDIAEGWTEEQKREFIVKDNVGFGEWDWDILANEWDVAQLDEWGLDLPPMFDDPDPEATEDDYTEPDQMQVDVVLGDLVEIGEHRLLCGDSTDSRPSG
jgi:ParB-like chromosome segregation protein Spo0J